MVEDVVTGLIGARPAAVDEVLETEEVFLLESLLRDVVLLDVDEIEVDLLVVTGTTGTRPFTADVEVAFAEVLEEVVVLDVVVLVVTWDIGIRAAWTCRDIKAPRVRKMLEGNISAAADYR